MAIFHTGLVTPALLEGVSQTGEPSVLVHRGFPPSEPYEWFDQEAAALLQLGPKLLQQLVERFEYAVALSDRASEELSELGFEDIRRARSDDRSTMLLSTEPYEPTVHHFAQYNAPMCLSVGDVAPHRRVEKVIQAYNGHVTFNDGTAVLAIVGATTTPAYERNLNKLINESNLLRAGLYGEVQPGELVATYQTAAAVICMSDYEYVSPMLIEAMAFGVPVIYREGTGAETIVGDAGVALPNDAGALLVAEAFAFVAEHELFRRSLGDRAKKRVEKLHALPTIAEVTAS